MVKRVNNLTAEQQSRMAGWAKRWIDIGLSCEPADWPLAEEGVRGCYAAAKLTPPRVIIHVGSPLVAVMAGSIADSLLRREDNPVRSAVRSEVGSAVRSAVRSEVGSAVGSAVDSAVYSAVDSEIYSAVRSEVRSAVDSAVRSAVGSAWHNYRGGNLWAAWYAGVSFYRDICGLESETLKAFAEEEKIVLSAGWTWLGESVCMISDRPAQISRDDRGRLHATAGPAIAWRDGWSLYFWHGTRVPAKIIEQPGNITAAEINGEHNVEVRRCMIDRIGSGRYIQLMNGEVLDNSRWGILYRCRRPGDSDMLIVEVTDAAPGENGEAKKAWLRVHPENRILNPDSTLGEPQALTALAAVAAGYGMTAAQYEKLAVRT
jgi:phage baseplate assembly protein W